MKLSLSFFFVLAHTIAGICQYNTAKVLNDSAVKLWKNQKYDTALRVVNEALTIARQQADTLNIAKAYNNTGLIYSSKGDAVKSIFYYEQSLALLRAYRNQSELPTALLNIGIAYKEQAIYDIALRYLFEAADSFKISGNLKSLSAAYNTIGNIFMLEKSFEKAIEFHNHALQLRQLINYKEGIAGSLNNIGIVYKKTQQYDSALAYFEASLKLKNENSTIEQKANTLSHMGDIYMYNGNFVRAEQLFNQAYMLRDSIKNKKGLAHSFYDLGHLYFTQNIFKKSEHYFLKGLQQSKEVNAADILLRCYGILRSLYRKTNNSAKALLYDDLYITLNEEVLGKNNQNLLTQMQVKYETEKKQNEITQLNQEKEKREAILFAQKAELEIKETRVLYLTISIIVLTILLLVIFRQNSRISKQRSHILIEKEKVSALMAEMHHRIKNNFQVLLSMFNLQLNDIKDFFAMEVIKINRDRITAMMLIHKELYLHENVTKINVDSYVYAIVENLRSIYGLKNKVSIKYDVDSISLDADKATSLGLLLNELVTNAFKYAFEDTLNPRLEIQFKKQQEKYFLLIADNGPGLFESNSTNSFGQKLIDTQVKKLKGDIKKKSQGGMEYKITF